MIIPKFYEDRWNKNIYCRKKYEDSKEKLDYLRTEYEMWALWIDKLYNGKSGLFTIGGDAPRYALEYELDFCILEDTYKKNYLKRDHFANQEIRSKDAIKRLTSLFNNAAKYVLRTTVPRSPDEDINLDLEEIKINMMKDPMYKEKWFKAVYEANDYIDKLLYKYNDVKELDADMLDLFNGCRYAANSSIASNIIGIIKKNIHAMLDVYMIQDTANLVIEYILYPCNIPV